MIYTQTFTGELRPSVRHAELPQEEVERRRYAFPEERKFPLTDRRHVLSAIKFFNYVAPKDEKTLADAILKRMKELGMKDVNVGETNRFRKYIEKPEDELSHHGVKGMHWGVRNAETMARYARSHPNKYGYDSKSKTYVKKSRHTRAFERLASSGEKQEKKQRELYKISKNPYNKASADKWKQESEENRRNAEKSFRRDIDKKTLSKKDYYVKTKADETLDDRLYNEQRLKDLKTLKKTYKAGLPETKAEMKKAGFSKTQIESATKYYDGAIDRAIAAGRDLVDKERETEKRIRTVDTSSKSYRKAKKEVDAILKEHSEYVSSRWSNYSLEEQKFRRMAN